MSNGHPAGGYIIGVDTGGTFTDCSVIDPDGRVYQDKATTTPHDLTVGILEALQNTAGVLGLTLEELLGRTQFLGHGTTAAINALISRRGVRTALITTKGHEDAILIGRVHQKVDGLSEREILDAARLDKAVPLVPRPLIVGINERVDYKGSVVVPLHLAEVEEALGKLVAEGVQAIAISFLWSFMNPEHEQAVKKLATERFPSIFVTVSSDVAPVMGEYERTATTVVNAYVGPIIANYLTRLEGLLRERGLTGAFLIMQALGGAIPALEAAVSAVNILSSGPVGGAMGSAFLARTLGFPNIITTDVGGTSFDVGLVVDGEPRYSDRPVFEKYALVTPTVAIESIGAGGGSIAWFERETGLLQVGPHSAGASPGPVCYGRGGTEPTVTDADVVLGRISPNYFFGGRLKLDRDAAWHAIENKVAKPLGMSVPEAAKGIIDIVDAHMADLVRKVSIESGNDPRDFVLFAYGGGGPCHVGAYAREIGVQSVVISPQAPVFSAFGIAGADIVRFYQQSSPMVYPWNVDAINALFDSLEEAANRDIEGQPGLSTLVGGGSTSEAFRLQRIADLRYRRQTHELRIDVPTRCLTDKDLDQLVDRFEQAYEKLYGKGTSYRQAGIELSTVRVRSALTVAKPDLRMHELQGEDASAALKGSRDVYFDAGLVPTPIYSADRLVPGNVVTGPTVIEGLATTVVVHPGQRVQVDAYGNFLLHA